MIASTDCFTAENAEIAEKSMDHQYHESKRVIT